MAAAQQDPQEILQQLSEDFRKVQQEMQNTIQAREKLDAQRQENLGVKKEFDRIKPGEDIYKLVGPVLLKQDKVEAESTVDGRLEFLRKELERKEDQIKELQNGAEKVRAKIIQVQSGLQGDPKGKAAAAG